MLPLPTSKRLNYVSTKINRKLTLENNQEYYYKQIDIEIFVKKIKNGS